MGKFGTHGLPKSRQSESAWEDLREVAKVGLDDPGLLTKCDYLLNLPSVRKTAMADDALSRARALVMLLRDLLEDLRRDASPERAAMIDCLFMLDPDWKGVLITRRREPMALAAFEGDTTTFRRDKENPLYKEIASLLSERTGVRVEDPRVQGREPFPSKWWVPPKEESRAALVRLLATIEYAQQKPHDLRTYAVLLVRFEELHRQQQAGYITIELEDDNHRPMLEFYRGLNGAEEPLLDLYFHDLSLLRHTCVATHPEISTFPALLEATKRGQAILEKWERWCSSCICSETAVDSQCKFHRLLLLWSTFGITLSKKYDLDFEPLDLEDTLGDSRALHRSTI